MAFAIVDDVRGFFVSRPPLVVFMICLASFAIALITFAYVIKVKDMPNPDITEDWNVFLDTLSHLDYCVVSEPGALASNSTLASAAANPLDAGLKSRLRQLMSDKDSDTAKMAGLTLSSPTPTSVASSPVPGTINVSFLIDLELMPTGHLLNVASRNNFTFITTTMKGSHLGLKGGRQDLEANVTLVLPALGNHSHNCQHGQCFKQSACITMVAPRQFFPRTQRPDSDEMCMREGDYAGENHFHLEVVTGYLQCVNASILKLDHQYDPTLTVMLTMDRSIINLHLMHTSYFLFVMIVTLFCYAVIKGRPSKVKVVYTQCPTDKGYANQP